MYMINIDGPNGIGKSSVVDKLVTILSEKGYSTKYIHFHRRDTLLGKTIQKVLDGDEKLSPYALQMIYSADRTEFSNVDYKTLYESGVDILIVDRYTTSGLVYGMLGGVSPEDILALEQRIVYPDVNIILRASSKTLQNRLESRVLDTIKEFKMNDTPEISKLLNSSIQRDSDLSKQTKKLESMIHFYNKVCQYVQPCSYINAEQELDLVVNDVLNCIKQYIEC